MNEYLSHHQLREIGYGEKLNPIHKPEFNIYIKVQNVPAHDIDYTSIQYTYQYQPIALLQKNSIERFECLSSVDAVLDPAFTTHKPNLSDNGNSIFGWQFGIFIEAADGSYFHVQPVENNKILSFYSINYTSLSRDLDRSNLDNLLTFGFPWNLRKSVFDLALQFSGISNILVFATSELIDTAKYYFYQIS